MYSAQLSNTITFDGQLSAQTEGHKSSVNPFPITYDAGFSWWSRRDGLVIQCPNTSLSRLFKQCLAQYCKYRTASKSNTPVLESPQCVHCIRIAFLKKKLLNLLMTWNMSLYFISCVCYECTILFVKLDSYNRYMYGD